MRLVRLGSLLFFIVSASLLHLAACDDGVDCVKYENVLFENVRQMNPPDIARNTIFSVKRPKKMDYCYVILQYPYDNREISKELCTYSGGEMALLDSFSLAKEVLLHTKMFNSAKLPNMAEWTVFHYALARNINENPSKDSGWYWDDKYERPAETMLWGYIPPLPENGGIISGSFNFYRHPKTYNNTKWARFQPVIFYGIWKSNMNATDPGVIYRNYMIVTPYEHPAGVICQFYVGAPTQSMVWGRKTSSRFQYFTDGTEPPTPYILTEKDKCVKTVGILWPICLALALLLIPEIILIAHFSKRNKKQKKKNENLVDEFAELHADSPSPSSVTPDDFSATARSAVSQSESGSESETSSTSASDSEDEDSDSDDYD